MSSYTKPYVHIGAGTCGTVFALPGSTDALKVALDDAWAVTLQRERGILEQINREFLGVAAICEIDLRIPQLWGYIDKHDFWWTRHHSWLPSGMRQDVLQMERIMPLPKSVRELLIDRYCPELVKEAARQALANRECLARVYIGRRRAPRLRPSKMFNMRNYGLCLDQMEELSIDPMPFVVTMAKATAFMHWRLKSDARDIEFVLGCSRVEESGEISSAKLADRNSTLSEGAIAPKPTQSSAPARTHSASRGAMSALFSDCAVQDFQDPTIALWMLDFNQVRVIEDPMIRIDQAVEAFLINDPYYPKPLPDIPADERLWMAFRDVYLTGSNIMLQLEEDQTRLKPNWKKTQTKIGTG
ncbi:hypothetical protein LTR56_010980 [Elasticomyces elasticus]|nr:hypothetical protein LTR56_010980 [Elasticomyces elasticus]KAK3662678.1 hypothetical protein LTR22_006528 [Elasticomyces elasticus]KAK4926539.1 hypothetical protein LTR49_006473 [Elasticomyces elasticus]KAK5760631.1 hypothetical protein LTS12_009168 [Elasticomyces elasticus]